MDLRLSKDHVVRVATIHWNVDEPELITLSGNFFEINEKAYLQLRNDDDFQGYIFYQVAKTGEAAGTLRLPELKAFETAVNKKELKGRRVPTRFGLEVKLTDGKEVAAYIKKHGDALFVKDAQLLKITRLD